MVGAPQRREAVRLLVDGHVSQRRACQLVGISRSHWQYRPRGRSHPQLVERLHSLAQQHPRYGYRRVWKALCQEIEPLNPKRIHRLWKLEGLSLHRRRRRKRRLSSGSVPCHAESVNHVWTYDFVHDSCANGQKLKMLTVLDEYSRYCLAIEVAGSISSASVIRTLENVFTQYGTPHYLRSDNGPEFIAQALQTWLKTQGIETFFIQPGSPWQNAYGESFNGKFRDECLNREWFYNLTDARQTIRQYRTYYNEQRLHSSLDYRTPAEYRKSATVSPGVLSPQHPRQQTRAIPFSGDIPPQVH